MGIEERRLSREVLEELSGVRISAPRSKNAELTRGFVARVPLHWIRAAAGMPGRTLHVALAIWHHHHLAL